MSTVIDQRVAELRFDNANFEKNVATSLSTLDKLKQALRLTGASKGLEQVSAASRNLDFNPLGRGVEMVSAKFSALQVMGVTALVNITNQAVNAGKRIAASLTIDPIKTGFKEYELKMGSIQTIMASTGESLETVNGYLNELNEYSDKTIYSFSDMTQNIGKFTNAGVKLKDAVAAIQGISNEAALSGANANEASRAMYNFAQALSAGYVKLIDWKSIENANMATVGFKNELINTAVELGTLTKVTDGYRTAEGKAITATKNFNDSLQDQWMTSDVLITTLKRYSDENTEIGKKATQAATEVKTFTQMLDSLKESAQSGWAQTWEIVFGDFNEGKSLWTGIYNFVGGILDKMSNWRNKILGIGLGDKFLAPLNKVKDVVDKVKEPIAKVTESLVDYKKVVDEIIGGKWGNGQARWDALAKAGYDWAHAQNLVNEKLGSSVRHSTNYKEATDKVTKSTEKATKANGKLIEELIKMDDSKLLDAGYSKEQIKNLREVEKLAEKLGISVKELVDNADKIDGRWLLLDSFKNLADTIKTIFKSIKDAWNDAFGFTDDEAGNAIFNLIAAFHRFSEAIQISDGTAAKITSTFKGLFAILDILLSLALTPIKIAFSLLGKSMKGITSGAGGILDFTAAVGENIAKFRDWLEEHNVIREGFENLIEKIGDLIDKFVELTGVTDIFSGVKKSLTDFKNTMKFSFSGPFKVIDEGIKKVSNGTKTLGGALADIVTGKGDIQQLSSFISKVGEALGDTAEGKQYQQAIQKIKSFCDSIVSPLRKAKDKILEIGSKIKDVIKALFSGDWDSFKEFGNNIVDGLGSGLVNGFNKVKNIIVKLANTVIEKFKDVLGIASPSKIFMWIAQMCLDGFMLGFKKTSLGKIVVGMLELGKVILNPLRAFLGINSPARKFIELAQSCVEGIFVGIKMMIPKVGAFFKDFGKNLLNFAKKIEWDKILIVGLSVGAFIGINKTLENINNTCKTILSPLKDVTGAFKTLSDSLSGFTNELKNLAKAKKTEAYSKILLNMAIAIVILVGAILILSQIPVGTLWASIGALAALAAIMLGLAFACKTLNDTGKLGVNATALLAIGGTMLALAVTLKLLSTIETDKIPGVIGMLISIVGSLGILVFAIGKFVKGDTAQNISKVGTLLLKMSVAFLLMIAVVKIASKMDAATVLRGVGALAAIELLFLGIIAVCKCVGEADASKAGSLLLKMSLAMIVMVGVVKLASKLKPREVFKGLAFVAAVEILFAAIIAVSYFAGEHASKAGTLMFKMGLAMLMMVAVVKIAATVDTKEIVKGVAIMAIFSLFISAFIFISQYAGKDLDKCGQMLISISIAMLIMVGIMIILKNLDPKGLGTALGVMYVLTAMCSTLIYVTSMVKKPEQTMKMLIVLAVIIGLLSGTLIALSVLNKKKVATAGAALSAVVGAFALLVKAVGCINAEQKTWKRGLVILGTLTLIVAAIAGIIYLLGDMKNPNAALGAAGGISLILITMAGAINVLGRSKTFTETKLRRILSAIAILSGVLIILAVVLRIMDGVNGAHAVGNAVALSVLLTALSLLVEKLSLMDGRRTQKLPKIIYNIALLSGVLMVLALVINQMKDVDSKQGIGSALILSELIVVLAGVVIALSNFTKKSGNIYGAVGAIAILSAVLEQLADVIIKMDGIDAQKAIPNATALSELLVVLGGVTIAISRFVKQSKGMYAATGAMAILGAVLYELAGALVFMNEFDTQNAITNATALSILIGVLGGVTYAFSWMGKYIAGLYAGMGAMVILGAVLFELAGVLILMSECDTKNAIGNAVALSILLTFMAPVAALFGAIGLAAGPMFAGIAAMGVMAIVVGLLGEVLVKMKGLEPGQAIGTVVALGILMGVLIPVMYGLMGIGTIIVSTGGMGAAAIAAGFAVMVAIVAGIAAVIAATGLIMDKFPSLETFVDKGLDLFKKLATGFGEIIGLLVGGVLSGVQSALPNFGKSLSDFITNLQGFIDGVRPLGSDESFKTGVKNLIETLLMFVAVEFLNGLTKLSTLGLGSLPSLGMELSMFMFAAQGFINGAKQLDPSLMEGVRTLSEAILILTAANFVDGLSRFITGGVDFSKFALGMSQLGMGLNGFITQVGVITPEQVIIAENAASIIKTLATAASQIPNTGGLLADLVGDNDLKTWASGLKDVAVGIAGFCSVLVGAKLSEDQVGIAQKAATIIKVLAQASKEIPNAGGALAKLIGDNTFDTWSTQLPKVGKGISGFCSAFAGTGLTEEQVTVAKNAAKIIKTLATASSEIPNAGGALAKIIGDNKFDTWATQLPKVGKGVANFATEVGTLDESSLATVKVAVSAIKTISGMSKSYDALKDLGDFTSFGDGMITLGEKINDFVDTLSDVSKDSVDSAVSKVKSVIKLMTTVADTKTGSLKTFGNSLKSIAKDGVKSLVSEFSKQKPKDDIKKAGEKLITSFRDGIKAKKEEPKKKVKEVAESAYKAAKSESIVKGFKTAGKDCVTGFANGIKNNKSLASDAGTALGKAALKAAKEALKEKSPSREMYKVGNFAGLGFTNALFDHESTAYDAGFSVAEYAKDGLSRAIAKVNSWFDGEITTQPTIRPVVDLSNVRSGAAAIDGMFGSKSIGLTANLNSINSRMSEIQNGGNDDVVAAIDKLRKDISKIGGTNNYIGSVNAGNDESVTEAIGVLIGAARRDRRS